MARPHIAALIEDTVYGRVNAVLRRRGWHERVIGFTGYGTGRQARIMARVLLTRDRAAGTEAGADAGASEQELDEAFLTQRGWRSFITAPAMDSPVTIELGAVTVQASTDRGGYIDIEVAGHGLEPGWQEVVLTAASGDRVTAAVSIIDEAAGAGIVSDIDDTVMVTHLPRILIAGLNTFVRSEQAREVVPGMARLYDALIAEHPGTPIFYLSTGAWNTAPTLTRFLRRNGYPAGPLLLTDWGPTNTGWFRSGQQHKKDQLHRLLREFPTFRWVLVGDDGQHDPMIYGEFAAQHPEAVDCVAIRQLTPAQQVLSHGFPVATDELLGKRYNGVPMVRATEGDSLHRLISTARARSGRA